MKNKKLKKKLMCYSSIAAGALAIAGQAEAAVVYSGPQNIVVNASNPFASIDLDNDAVPDFGIGAVPFGNPNAHIIYGLGSEIAENIASIVNLSYNYNIRNTLGGGRFWLLAPPVGYLDLYINGNGYGNFIGTTGYIGVRFNTDCGTAYGWIQYRANNDATEGTIIDWAYENTCRPIRAGDKGQQVAVPAFTPAGIAVAAGLLSGAGIRALRKRKKEGEK